MLLKWGAEYSVNVKEIDEQHKNLFSLVNNVLKKQKKFKKEEVVEIIKSLEDYSDYHFNTEEKYFELFNYKDKEIHKREHRSYSQKVSEFKKRIQEEEHSAVVQDIAEFLRGWWINHVLESDFKYSDLFNQNGLY